jgi:hypothetical protein
LSSGAWISLIVAGILVPLTLPALARQARRENDPVLLWLLVFALVLKFAGALFRHYVSFEVYEEADAAAYHQAGVAVLPIILRGDWGAVPQPLTDVNLLGFLTGLVYVVVGPNTVAGFLIFSWLGFWGLFYFYRAFQLAIPEGRSRSYARLLFLLPSMLYWTSSIGKEAWMMFALGIAAFGVARILTGSPGRGIALTGVGLWFAALVRPHIATIAAVGLVFAYMARRPAGKQTSLVPIVKLVTLVGLSAVVLFLFRDAEEYLTRSKVDPQAGVASVSREIAFRTSQGGSQFQPHPVLESPAEAPLAVFTVLFRPTVVEADNLQVVGAALEASFLLLLSLFRIPWALSALRSMRRRPYLVFAFVNVVLFIVALSVLANFGLLARQRTLLMPLYLALITIPPRSGANEERSRGQRELVTWGVEGEWPALRQPSGIGPSGDSR